MSTIICINSSVVLTRNVSYCVFMLMDEDRHVSLLWIYGDRCITLHRLCPRNRRRGTEQRWRKRQTLHTSKAPFLCPLLEATAMARPRATFLLPSLRERQHQRLGPSNLCPRTAVWLYLLSILSLILHVFDVVDSSCCFVALLNCIMSQKSVHNGVWHGCPADCSGIICTHCSCWCYLTIHTLALWSFVKTKTTWTQNGDIDTKRALRCMTIALLPYAESVYC